MIAMKRNEDGADPDCKVCHGSGKVNDRVPRPFGPGNVSMWTTCECVAPDLRWSIVAFDHPQSSKSVLYRQNLSFDGLLAAVKNAHRLGANLMSIRGVE